VWKKGMISARFVATALKKSRMKGKCYADKKFVGVVGTEISQAL
jgi:hypothetical protein